MNEQLPRRRLGTVEAWRQGSFAEIKHGVVDVAIGGGLYGAVSGAFFGALWGVAETQEAGVAIVMGLIGFIAGTVGGSLIGALVGLAGELLTSRLSLDHLLRRLLGGRLDRLAGRLSYGAMVGLLGGPPIWVLAAGCYEGFEGLLNRIIQGAVAWTVAGLTGGLLDWLATWAIESGGMLGGAIIGGLAGLAVSLVGAAIGLAAGGLAPLVLAGALIPPIFGTVLGMLIAEV
jgi:hypothetical protein